MSRVLLDCDGVLLDYVGGFRSFLVREHGVTPSPEGPESFNIWAGLEEDALTALIRAFNAGDGTGFENLPALPGAVSAIRKMFDEGLDLRVVTSCSNDPKVARNRLDNLERVFGPVFQEIDCLSLGAGKAEALRRHPISDWVEDNVQNAVCGLKAGHRPHLVRQSWNAAFETDGSVPGDVSWHDDLAAFRASLFREDELFLI